MIGFEQNEEKYFTKKRGKFLYFLKKILSVLPFFEYCTLKRKLYNYDNGMEIN